LRSFCLYPILDFGIKIYFLGFADNGFLK